MYISFLYKTESIFDAEWQWCAALALCNERHSLTTGTHYARITKRYSLSSASVMVRRRRRPQIDPDEEDDMPDDKDSAVGDWHRDTREEEEEEVSHHVFDAGQGSVGDHLSLRAASESSQSRGGTEDDPIGPITPSAAPTMASGTISLNPLSSTFRTRSPWTRRTSMTKSGSTRRRYLLHHSNPPSIAETKSSNSAKSRNCTEADTHVPFPSSVAEGTQEGKPRRVP